MMYKRIILMIVWSLVIGIKSQTPDYDQESLIKEYLDKELNLFDVVVSYYKKINTSSKIADSLCSRIIMKTTTLNKRMFIPNDKEAIALIQATFFTFWMAVTLRIYSEFNSCIYANEPKREHDLYFNEMMFAFNEFKKEIEKFRKSGEKRESKSVVGDINNYGHVTVEAAADIILSLSLDFVSSENTLMRKKPDKYRKNGIIKWDSIQECKVGRKRYKTVFPSCAFIRSSFHNEVIETKCLNNLFDWFTRTLRILRPVEYYSKKENWEDIMNIINFFYTSDIQLTYAVKGVIDFDHNYQILDFLTEETLGREKAQSVNIPLRNRSWMLSNLDDTSKVWDAVEQANFINENIEMSPQDRIENVIALVKIIREVDKTAQSLGTYF